jgi:enoyl-CoA hydratase
MRYRVSPTTPGDPMSGLTSYEHHNGIATIKMDDGKVNALGIPMLRELHSAFDRAENDHAIVILTGREGRFSAGFDLSVFTDTPEQLPEMLILGATLCERILAFPHPVITACTGHGVAAGCFIQLPADLRLGVDGPFQIGLNEVRIGLTMPQFVIELARSRLTPAQFDRAVNSAVIYAPRDAVAAGFLDRVVPAGELHVTALEAARDLAGLNDAAHKATKLKSRASLIDAVHAAIQDEFEPAT